MNTRPAALIALAALLAACPTMKPGKDESPDPAGQEEEEGGKETTGPADPAGPDPATTVAE